jgi:hypothetical protein
MQADNIDWETLVKYTPPTRDPNIESASADCIVSGNLLHAINMLIAPLDMLRSPVFAVSSALKHRIQQRSFR